MLMWRNWLDAIDLESIVERRVGSTPSISTNVRMAKLVAARDLKSLGHNVLVGSIPTSGT